MTAIGRILTAALVVLTLGAANGWSQPVAAQMTPLSPATHPELRVGRKVWVTVADGSVIEGKITSVSDTELDISTGQIVKSLPWRTVQVVEAKDSLGNGLRIGLFGGAGVGALGGVFLNSVSCSEGAGCSSYGAAVLFSALTVVMVALPVSLLIDYVHTGRQSIYRPAAQVSVGPLITPGRFGVGGVVRW